jgi:hypothetical protein
MHNFQYDMTPLSSIENRQPAHKRPALEPILESPSQKKSCTEKSALRLTFFRITGVASDCSEDGLRAQLSEIDPNFGFQTARLSIFPSCSPNEMTNTALLCLNTSTALFEAWKRDKKEELQHVRLDIDSDFFGLTPLNNPDKPIRAEQVPLNIHQDYIAN